LRPKAKLIGFISKMMITLRMRSLGLHPQRRIVVGSDLIVVVIAATPWRHRPAGPQSHGPGQRVQLDFAGKRLGGLAAGADAGAGEHLRKWQATVAELMDTARRSRGWSSLAGQAGDMRFAGGQGTSYPRGAFGCTLARRAQLYPCPFGKRPGTGSGEDLVSGARLTADFIPAALVAQPLAVEQVSAG
jgi:hypothetical protein